MNSKKLKNFLDSRGIEAVVFDVDNTLLATGEYYRKNTKSIGIQIAPKIDKSRDPEEISKEIEDVIYAAYVRDGKKPLLIDAVYMRGLEEYTGENLSYEMKNYVVKYFSNFYLESPTPFKYTAVVLQAFFDLKKSVVLHSHAQEGWTRIKVNLLEELVGEELPYLSTEIDDEKDKESWLEAFELTNSKAENIMVVGDNFEADMLPAIEAGCKHLVWLDTSSVGLDYQYSIPTDVEISIINKIEDILTLE